MCLLQALAGTPIARLQQIEPCLHHKDAGTWAGRTQTIGQFARLLQVVFRLIQLGQGNIELAQTDQGVATNPLGGVILNAAKDFQCVDIGALAEGRFGPLERGGFLGQDRVGIGRQANRYGQDPQAHSGNTAHASCQHCSEAQYLAEAASSSSNRLASG